MRRPMRSLPSPTKLKRAETYLPINFCRLVICWLPLGLEEEVEYLLDICKYA